MKGHSCKFPSPGSFANLGSKFGSATERAVKHWARDLTSLSLCFFIFQMGTVMTLPWKLGSMRSCLQTGWQLAQSTSVRIRERHPLLPTELIENSTCFLQMDATLPQGLVNHLQMSSASTCPLAGSSSAVHSLYNCTRQPCM